MITALLFSILAAAPGTHPTLSDSDCSVKSPCDEELDPVEKPTSKVHREPRVREPRWSKGDPLPFGYHLETRRRLVMAGFGAAILALALTADWPLTAVFCRGCSGGQVGSSFVPVAGPILQFFQLKGPTCVPGKSCDGEGVALAQAALFLDGLAQLFGAGLLLGGIFSRHTVLVDDDAISGLILPLPVNQGFGLAAAGRF